MTNWDLSIEIEHKVQKIITQQEINGFYFDIKKAVYYVEYLEKETDRLYKEIRPILVPEVVRRGKTVERPFTKSGGLCSRANTYLGNSANLLNGPFSAVEFHEPELSSRQKVIKQLVRLGWKPISYTEKGNPKLDEESLMGLDMPEGALIATWYVLKHRQAQIRGWLELVREDHRITSYANPCGTNTGRMRHKGVVNVPKASDSVIFGREMRSLFTVPEGYVLIGHDASGLELRMLAHYINNPEYTEILLNGDPHSKNQEDAGLPTRDDAKTFIYAFIYGAGDSKIGSIVGGNAKDGKEIKRRFLSRNPDLARLIKQVQRSAERGYLIGLDGRRLYIRSKHSALNVLLQGGGAIVMKVSMILLDKWMVREGPYTLNEVKKVVDMHDESGAEVVDNPKIIQDYSESARRSIIESGRFFKLNCPLDADVKVGKDWSQTH